MTTLVSVGNATQPFPRLLQAVSAMARRLPQPVVVQHGHTPFQASEGIVSTPFVAMDEFARLLAEASLVITHAGAGTVISALRARKTPVVMPRSRSRGEHVDDHQMEFARELERLGRIAMATQASDLERAIARAMELQATLADFGEPRLVRLVRERLQAYLSA